VKLPPSHPQNPYFFWKFLIYGKMCKAFLVSDYHCNTIYLRSYILINGAHMNMMKNKYSLIGNNINKKYCPVCWAEYDDSWNLCIHDGVKLLKANLEEVKVIKKNLNYKLDNNENPSSKIHDVKKLGWGFSILLLLVVPIVLLSLIHLLISGILFLIHPYLAMSTFTWPIIFITLSVISSLLINLVLYPIVRMFCMQEITALKIITYIFIILSLLAYCWFRYLQ
jgi:hypothetical protein